MDDVETGTALDPQPEDGQPSEESIAKSDAAGQEVKQDYITEDVFERKLNEAIDKLSRTIQSFSDKAENRIKKEVESKLARLDSTYKTMKAAGMDVSEEAYKAERNRIQAEALRKLSTDEAPAASPAVDASKPPVQNPPLPPDYDEFNDGMDALTLKYGLGLNSAEFRTIQGNTAKEALASAEALLKAKAERLGKSVPSGNVNQPPAARSPGALVGKAAGDKIEQLTSQRRELMKDPSKHVREIRKITQELDRLLKNRQ